MTSPSKPQRLLDLLAYLVGRRFPVPVDEIMRGVPAYAARAGSDEESERESVRRMFERDKDELRELGIPLETVRYSIDGGLEEAEGYLIRRRDFYLPYLELAERARAGAAAKPYRDPGRIDELELTREEGRAAFDALSRVADLPAFPFAPEARSAMRKLSFDIDPEAFRAPPVLQVERPGSEELLERVRTLSEALLARKRVRFAYHGIYRGQTTRRDVAGYGLFFQRGHWYLIGHDALREDLRIFRVDRMDDVVANARRPKTPDYDVPADFRLSDRVGREAWELGAEEGAPLRARVLFRFPRSLWAERNRHGTLEEEHDDGSATRAFDVHQVNPFLRWILTLEGDAEILDPPELRAELERLAREVVALHS